MESVLSVGGFSGVGGVDGAGGRVTRFSETTEKRRKNITPTEMIIIRVMSIFLDMKVTS